MEPDTVHLLFNYHYWRAARMLSACEALTREQWDQPLAPSWGSVHALLVHMVAAEQIWLGRWKGVSAKAMPPAEALPELADVRRAWNQVEAELRAFLDQCNETRLRADITYTNTQGNTYTLPLGGLMLHVVDHATHHRGELVAMLTILDIPHPDDGLVGFLIDRSRRSS